MSVSIKPKMEIEEDADQKTQRREEIDTIVIYHGGCSDGTSAAWCLSLMLNNHRTLYHYGKHGESESTIPDCSGCIVYFVDFCYPLEVIRSMLTKAKCIRVLDHHVTTEKILELEGHPKLFIILDNNRSGAQIAFDYMIDDRKPSLYESDFVGAIHFSNAASQYNETARNPSLTEEECEQLQNTLNLCRVGHDRPWFINDIADRDLWRWKIPGSIDRTKAMFFYGLCSTVNRYYDLILKSSQYSPQRLTDVGKILNEYDESIYSAICKSADDVNVDAFVLSSGAKVPVRARIVECPYNFASMVGSRLTADGTVHFAAMYRYDFKNRKWHCSVRSNPAQKTVDLTVMLPKLDPKSGGHRSSAGMTLEDLHRFFVLADPRFTDAACEISFI